MKKFTFYLCCILCAVICAVGLMTQDQRTDPVEAKKKIRIGVLRDRPPLASMVDGSPEGLAVELVHGICSTLNIEEEFAFGRAVELYEQLEKGTIELAVLVPRVTGQTSRLTFIPTGFSLNRRIFVTDVSMDIRSESDFSGHSIAFVKSDSRYANIARNAGADVVIADDMPSALDMLINHDVDAYITHLGEVVASLAWKKGLTGINIKGGSLERTELYLVTEEHNIHLSARLADFLTTLENNGTLMEMREKWLGAPVWRESFWEQYKMPIIYFSLGVACLITIIIIWNVSLQYKVSRATDSLRASETRYRELTEASPDGVILLDEHGGYLYANPVARKLLNSYDMQLCGYSLAPETHLGELAQDIRAGRYGRRECVLPEKNGQTRHFEIMTFPATLDGRGTPGVCTLWRDITARRILEQELARTDRMSIIGRMAAGVAHEINNPLGVIMANAEYLAEKGVGGTQVEAILAHGEKAESSIRRLLNLAPTLEIRRESLNLTEVVQECILFLHPWLRKVDVDAHLPDWLPVRGDRGMLEQVVLNLIINALDSMKDSGRLTITGESRHQKEADTARIIIADDGPGIAESDMDRIFDLFYSTKGSQGFGIGLYVARNIAEMHNGTLRAESKPGETRFILDLPLLV